MVTPAATAARMPEQCRCSASRLRAEGYQQADQNLRPSFFAEMLGYQFFATVTIQVTPTPSAMPPIATHRNVSKASTSEKRPGQSRSDGKRMQTRPEASLSRDSPSRMCIKRLGIGTRAAIADRQSGPSGETIAASAKAMATGISGIIQLIKKPTPTTVNTTRPSASSRIVPLSRNRPSWECASRPERQAAAETAGRRYPASVHAEIGHGGDDRANSDLNER